MLQRLFPSLVQNLRITLRQAIYYAVAAVAAAIAFGFFVGFCYVILTREFGPLVATLVMTGVFLVVAGILVLIARRLDGDRPRKEVSSTPAIAPGFATGMSESLLRIGFRREALALRAAAEAARFLRPLHMVAFSILAGFIFGRRFEKR
jgi:hypothetical protein